MFANYWDRFVTLQMSTAGAILLSTPFARHPILMMQWMSVVLFVMGFVVVTIAATNLGSAFTPAATPKNNVRLATSGMYNIVRHPIYTGIILISIGWSLFWGSLLSLLFSLVLITIFAVKTKKEELFLSAKYPEHADYIKRVKKKIIPFVY